MKKVKRNNFKNTPKQKRQNRINIQLNYFGPFIEEKNFPKILDPKIGDGTKEGLSKDILINFFGLPVEALSGDILKRYTEITTEDTHTPIVPHTERIFERILKPLGSSKRNYCLGEYSATIALSGMVAEMLVLLIWEINDVRLGGKKISKEQE